MDRQRRLPFEQLFALGRRMFVLVLAVGLGGGLIGAAYVSALKLLEHVLWPTHWSDTSHLFVMVAVGAVVSLLIRWLGTPGDVELLVNNIHVLGGNEDIRELRSLVPVSLLCIAAGGAMGPEAPLVQTGGNFGSWLAWRFDLTRSQVRILTITGMAAAFTVLFGAPMGSAIFALEILHRRGLQYYEALLPAVLGSLVGYAVYAFVTGVGLTPVWHFPPDVRLRIGDLGWAVVCGAVGAAVAVVFTYLCKVGRWAFRRLPVVARPVVGGLVLGLLAFWSPYALTYGEAQVDPLLARRALAGVFIVAVLAKLIGTSVTLTSGWRGGFIIPMFFIGSALGRLGHVWFPSSHEVVLMVALMAAVNVGVTKTPLGSTLIVAEMAGLRLLPTTLIASVLSLLFTSSVSLIHTQRERYSDDESPEGEDTSTEDTTTEGGAA